MGRLAAQRLEARLESDLPIVLDGGMASALARAGLDVEGAHGTAVAMQGHMDTLVRIHREFADAGVHVLRTNTTDTTPVALQRAGYGYRAAKLSNRAVDAAMEVADESERCVAVAGVLPTSEEELRGRATDFSGREELLAHAQRLAAGGCDLLIVHGASTLKQAVTATAAADHTALITLVELVVGDDGRLSDGEPLQLVTEALSGAGASGFIAVTHTPASELQALSLLSGQRHPWGIQRAACESHPDDYAARVASFVSHGARFVGGEPGATPQHIRALLARIPQAAREIKRPSMLPPVP